MNEAISRIEAILKSKYSVEGFLEFVTEIFDSLRVIAPNNFHKEFSNYSSHIEGYSHVGEYRTPDEKCISVFSAFIITEVFPKINWQTV